MTNDSTTARRFKPIIAIPIMLIHAIALLAVHPYFFSWAGLIACLVLWWLTISLGMSLGYHRLLSHRAWKAKPGLRYFLMWCASLALAMGPLSWSATHRLHHRESDHEDDPHSPLKSFIWSHIGWLFYTDPKLSDPAFKHSLVKDLARDKGLRYFERTFYLHATVAGLVLFGAGYMFGGLQLALSLLIWGGFVRTVISWHAAWCVNSVTHLFGYRNYSTEDDSRNLWWVALLTWGEGWHNNHHAQAGTANFGRKWWELDPTYWALCVFNWLGWVEKANLGERLKADSPVVAIRQAGIAQSRRLMSFLSRRRNAEATD